MLFCLPGRGHKVVESGLSIAENYGSLHFQVQTCISGTFSHRDILLLGHFIHEFVVQADSFVEVRARCNAYQAIFIVPGHSSGGSEKFLKQSGMACKNSLEGDMSHGFPDGIEIIDSGQKKTERRAPFLEPAALFPQLSLELMPGIEAGQFRPVDVALTSAAIKAMLQDWYLKRWKYSKRKTTIDQYASLIIHFIESSIKPVRRRTE